MLDLVFARNGCIHSEVQVKQTLIRALLLACVAGLAGIADAQTFPSRPIRLVVPYPPGGPTDIVARLIADRLPPLLGQPVVVDNRPGAVTNIGTEAVVRAAPDAHTILMASFANALNKSLVPSITWDPVNDLTGVTQISSAPTVMVVPAGSPADSLEAFVALAKKQPGKLNYGVGGAGSSSHLAGELLKTMSGIDVVPIIYKGGGPAMLALLQGDVQLMFDNMQTVMPLLKAGKVRALAVTSKTRTPALPQVPAMHESLPGYELYSWYGFLAPAMAPPEAIRILEQTVAKVLAQPEVRERFATLDITAVGGSAAEFTAFYRTETEKWARVVKAANIKLE